LNSERRHGQVEILSIVTETHATDAQSGRKLITVRGDSMPVIWMLQEDHHAFGPEDIKVLTAAFDDALRALGLADRAGPVAKMIAKRIIELARLGERDPVRLLEYALEIDRAPNSQRNRVTTKASRRIERRTRE
jgi:hypothetical protein